MNESLKKVFSTCDKDPLLTIRDLNIYYGDYHALNNVNLSVSAHDYLGIIGPNGGGKTTLLKAILGLIPIASGTIQLTNQNGSSSKPSIGYVPSITTFDRSFPISVEEAILMGRIDSNIKPFFSYSPEDQICLENVLQMIHMTELRHKQLYQLSSGEFQKVLIARALIFNRPYSC